MVLPHLDDFPTTNEVLEENQKTRDRSPTIKFLEKFSQFSVERGNKGIQKEYDYVLKYHGHKVTFIELAMMCAFMFWNEDSTWPRGILVEEVKDGEMGKSRFQGGKMLQALINSSMELGFPTKELIKANNLDKFWPKNS